MALYKKLPFDRRIDHAPGLFSKFLQTVWARRRLLLALLLGGGLIIGGGIGYGSYREQRQRNAFELLEKNPDNPQELLTRYPRSDAAQIARMFLAEQALRSQQWDQAISLYEEILKVKIGNPFFRVTAHENLALAYRGKKDLVRSAELLRETVKDPENPAGDHSRLLLARVLGESDQPEEAEKILQELASSEDPLVRERSEKVKEWLKSSAKK